MLVMDIFTRRIIGFGVERANIDGVSVCRMFNYATAGEPMPARISTDHDPLFRFHRWLANLRWPEGRPRDSVRDSVIVTLPGRRPVVCNAALYASTGPGTEGATWRRSGEE